MKTKTNKKPVINPATPTRKRDAVLLGVTVAKLKEVIGEDTVILVSKKHLRSLINKAAADKVMASL